MTRRKCGERERRTAAAHHIFTLRLRHELAVRFRVSRRDIAREKDAGAGRFVQIAEHHRLDNDGSPEVVGNAVDRKSTRLNSSHSSISYAVFCLKKIK